MNLVISEAISRSNRLDRAASAFSVAVARFAAANSRRFWEAPTFARDVLSVSTAFEIACDAASASELVVPIVRDGQLIAVLDLDSPTPARFTEDDEAGCVALCDLLAKVL